ncbi:hypothetical protein LVD15_01020 [Fulvivirga maritima]|uniref:hypothetical protein n=1 Tax=Fulvivirga maritima TaxID=2904247 RepID=UPI001F312676|nr:hypothetical protein [Fulvivirga maritima]UII27047.1 hypothetical protein LVD15_01020 [Fulvivirga maritima]
MKKLLLIAVLMTGVSLHSSQAQRFIASFGVQHSWGVPTVVSHVVYDNYHGYEWVHTKRHYLHGQLFFDVVLQQSNYFIELRVDNFGHVVRREYVDYYPLHDHICGSYCGYYSNYYNSHYSACHDHHHHGHNHVVYVNPAPRRVVYVQPKTTVVYKNNSSHHHSNRPVSTRRSTVSNSRSQPARNRRYYDADKYESNSRSRRNYDAKKYESNNSGSRKSSTYNSSKSSNNSNSRSRSARSTSVNNSSRSRRGN